MKKNLVYILSLICITSAFVLSCDTKDDPPVPNHETTSISSTSSTSSTASTASSNSSSTYSFKFDGISYTLDSVKCANDTSTGFTMVGKNSATNSGIIILLGGEMPTANNTYTVEVGTMKPEAGKAQVYAGDKDGNDWICMQGTISVIVSAGKISASSTNLVFTDMTSPTTKSGSCSIGCQ